MASEQKTYPITVDSFLVDRNDLGPFGRFAALLVGKWPKVWLHKIECPCCGKVTFHRSVGEQRRSNV